MSKAKHTPLPWVVDDRHIHPSAGLTYPGGQEPETDIIVEVDTSMHDSGLLNETDKANLKFIVRACNSHEGLLEALKGAMELLGNSDVRFLICDGGEGNLGEHSLYHRTFNAARAEIERAERGAL